MARLARPFLGAVAFLTRIPAGVAPHDREQLAASVAWFPLVGALVGGAIAAVFALALTVVAPLLAAVFAVGTGMALTGAIHEDGLADTLDALGGGRSQVERLRILQDPAVGVFGALGLVMFSLALVAALAGLGAWEATGGLVAAHSMARATAVATMATAPLARSGGLGAAHTYALRTIGVVAVLAVVAAGAEAGATTTWWAP